MVIKRERKWLLWNTNEFDRGRELQDNKQKEQTILEISGAQPDQLWTSYGSNFSKENIILLT